MNNWTICLLAVVTAAPAASAQEAIGLLGGRIFDGTRFVAQDLFIADGKLTLTRPDELDRVIDCAGQFVVPPYGDAHTHNLDRRFQLPSVADQYLAEGTFYVQNLTSKTNDIAFFREHFATPTTPDVSFAHQGLTSTLGHPFLAYEPYAMGIYDPRLWIARMDEIKQSRVDENNSYIFLDDVDDCDAKLPAFFAAGPDNVKIFLVDVQNYAQNSTNDMAGDAGLSKELAKLVTERAHSRGLRVWAHINTATDFSVAIDVGVDCLAHMPTWDGLDATKPKFTVARAVLERAAKRGVGITPTITNTMTGRPRDEAFAAANAFCVQFLRDYVELGGPVLAGSDLFGRTLRPEIETWLELEIFEPLQLLRILCHDTPRSIFPDRRIGRLQEGFEGSVLVLGADPLQDSKHLFDIRHRIKQGHILP